MLRAHQPLVVERDVLIEVILVDILQVMRADQVVIGHSGDGQHRRTVDLGVVQPVEQMHRTGRGGGEADAEPAGEFRIGARSQRGRLLVPAMD